MVACARMARLRLASVLFPAVLLAAACGAPTAAPTPAANGSGGAPTAGTGGSNGSGAGGDARTNPGGSGGQTAAGTGGTDAGDASVVPIAPPDAATSADAGATGPFHCSEMIGLWVMSQWWGPFEKGVDASAWQYIFVHHGYLETWADPASTYWKTGVISACAAQSANPDRVIFLPFSLTLNTAEQWQTNLEKVVANIKAKFAGVQRIEFITTIRSPNNQPCPNDSDPNVVVPSYVDQAIQTVADASGGLVTAGPKIAVADCNWWAGGTDLTGAGNNGVGQLYSAYYQEHR